MPQRTGNTAPALRTPDDTAPTLYVEPPGLLRREDGSGYFLAPGPEHFPNLPADVTPGVYLALTKERPAQTGGRAERTIRPRPVVKCVEAGDDVIVVAKIADGRPVEFRIPREKFSRDAAEKIAAAMLHQLGMDTGTSLRVLR